VISFCSLFTAAQFLRRWFPALTQTVTQARNSERKAPEIKNCRLSEHFRQAAQFFSLFSSDAFHETADFLCSFFFHICRDMGVGSL
jgi:hypothetical protein